MLNFSGVFYQFFNGTSSLPWFIYCRGFRSSLERSPLFTLHRYVLAPISEGVYARARIVAKKEFTEPVFENMAFDA